MKGMLLIRAVRVSGTRSSSLGTTCCDRTASEKQESNMGYMLARDHVESLVFAKKQLLARVCRRNEQPSSIRTKARSISARDYGTNQERKAV